MRTHLQKEDARPLTRDQYGRMQRLARVEPEARVVGWDPRGGPLVRRQTGAVSFVTPLGRLKKGWL